MIETTDNEESREGCNVIVQRINDLKKLCAESLDNFSKDLNDNVIMLDNTSDNDENSTNTKQQQMMTGVVVNGFHPQLSTWQRNQSKIEMGAESSNRKLGREICQAVDTCRTEENESIRSSKALERPRFSMDTDVSDIYSDVFENSSVAQVIATPGGRFGAWNKEFLRVCSFAPSGPYASLTVFDLVQPSALPHLHQIFLTALHDEVLSPMVGKNNTSTHELQYLVLTVPCIRFSTFKESYFMTLSLMGDKDPDKKCFHCIISSNPISKVGEIVYIQQDDLMRLL